MWKKPGSLRKQRHVSGGQFQKPTLGITLLKEEVAHPAVLLRKKTSENKSGARIEHAAVSMHNIYTFWHPSPKAPSKCSAWGEIKVLLIICLVLFCMAKKGGQPLDRIQKCLSLPETVGLVPWRNRYSIHNYLNCTTAKVWIISYISFSFPFFLT